jgi:hypothetical protein
MSKPVHALYDPVLPCFDPVGKNRQDNGYSSIIERYNKFQKVRLVFEIVKRNLLQFASTLLLTAT